MPSRKLPKSIRSIIKAFANKPRTQPDVSLIHLLAGSIDGFRTNIGSPYLNQMLAERSARAVLIVGDENIFDHHPDLARSILQEPTTEQGDMLARIAVAMHKSGVQCSIVNHDFAQFHVDAERLHCMAKEIAQTKSAVMASADAALILEFICDPDGDMARDRNHDGDPALLGMHPDWEASSLAFWPTAVLRAVQKNDEPQYDVEFLSILKRMVKKWGPLGNSAGEVVYDMRALIGDLCPDLQQPAQADGQPYQVQRVQQDAILQELLKHANDEPRIMRTLSWKYVRKEERDRDQRDPWDMRPDKTLANLTGEKDPVRRADLIVILLKVTQFARAHFPATKDPYGFIDGYQLHELWQAAFRLAKKPATFSSTDAMFVFEIAPFLEVPALYQSLARAIDPTTVGLAERIDRLWDSQHENTKGSIEARKSIEHLRSVIAVSSGGSDPEADLEENLAHTIQQLWHFVVDDSEDLKDWGRSAEEVLDEESFERVIAIGCKVAVRGVRTDRDNAISLYAYARAIRSQGDQLIGTAFAQALALAKYGAVSHELGEVLTAYDETILRYIGACKAVSARPFYRAPTAELMAPCIKRSAFYLQATDPVRVAFKKLEEICGQAPLGAKPSATWLKSAKAVFDDNDLALLDAHMDEFLASTDPGLPESVTDYDALADAPLAAIMWLMSVLPMQNSVKRLTDYALLCYSFQSGRGLKAEKVGNACLWALQALPATESVAGLAQVAARMTYPKMQQKTRAVFRDVAMKAALAEHEIADMLIPDHGFAAGVKNIEVAHGAAVMELDHSGTINLSWEDADGNRLKTPSEQLRNYSPKEIKAIRKLHRLVNTDLETQLQRIAQFPNEGRLISPTSFQTHYINGGLIGPICRTLIWKIGRTPALWQGDIGMTDINGHSVVLNAQVSVWSPSSESERSDWAKRLGDLGVSQPFDQCGAKQNR